MRTHPTWVVAFLVAMFAAACGSDGEPAAVGSGRDAGTVASDDEVPDFQGNFDDVLRQVGRTHPPFAGFRVDESVGTTTVLLKGSADRATAEAVVELLAVAFDDPTFRDRRVVVDASADYSFAELFDWYRLLRREVGAVPGLVTGDIDEAANRIAFGVEDLSVADRVEAIVEEHEVPREAVVIEEQAPIRANRR